MRRSLLSRTGWLALGSSVAVHALLFTLIWLLPSGEPARTASLPVDSVVLSDNLLMPGDSPPGKGGAGGDEDQPDPPQPPLTPVTLSPSVQPDLGTSQAAPAVSTSAQPGAPIAGAQSQGPAGGGGTGAGAASFFEVP